MGSYLVVLVLMYAFTQRLFPVPYEWRRLALVLLSAAGLVAAGELLLPTSGAIGLLSRGVLWLAYPVLYRRGFLHEEERTGLAELLRPSAIAARAKRLRAATATPGPRRTSIPTSARGLRGRGARRGPLGGPDRPGLGGVVCLGRLAHALAAAGSQRLAGVEPVRARVLASQEVRGERPRNVRPGRSRRDSTTTGLEWCFCM